MTHEYAMSRVEDALTKSEGNALKAQRLVLSWLAKDQTLLIGLIEPHLQAIVAHAVAHALLPRNTKTKKKISMEELRGAEMGNALLSTLSNKTGSFGEPLTSDPAPLKASKSHADAMRIIAEASKKNKKKD